ncbi:MAG: type II toxin-antitoxin system RatA family toxin [Magnetococcales bacterium]|nr:type II toxin-antitoxin system RatA family toxin [Magnetococcales bacterium]
MAIQKASAVVPYSQQQMFDLVVDMDSYPLFLPWCLKARKFDVTTTQFMAEMTVSFKGLRESFQTVDRIWPPERIQISLHHGPFSHLDNEWRFTALEAGSRVDFIIDFNFRKRLLDLTLGPFFGAATQKMVEAFRKRADAIYGTESSRPSLES